MHSFLTDRFETLDGSTPHPEMLSNALSSQAHLSAFSILRGGDAFDSSAGAAPKDARKSALDWLREKVTFQLNATPNELKELISTNIVDQIRYNPGLVLRLRHAKGIEIDVIPSGESMIPYGFPAQITPEISGIFWNHPTWEQARIGFRQEFLHSERTLVFHEMAHAIHYLAFTSEERKLIYQFLQRSFGSNQAMDEVFAIYSEREFIDKFSHKDKSVRGIYGITRSKWSENHVFTRFIRKLYFPHKPLAGPKLIKNLPKSNHLKLPYR